MLSWTKNLIVKILVSLKNFIYAMTYEDGAPSKGYIGFWVCLAVILVKFIKHGGDIPDNWLTLIMALLAYNGLKKPVQAAKAYMDGKGTKKTATTKDDEEPVN